MLYFIFKGAVSCYFRVFFKLKGIFALLKVFKACVRGFFQGKMFIGNISGYNDVIETKFGTWTDFTVLDILSDNGNLCGRVT